jgi:hypothetical protein
MEYLFENPFPLLMVGLVLMTFTGVVYYTTRSTAALISLVLIIALSLSLLVMEQLVQTPREGVIITLRAATTAAEANDMERVLSFVDSEAAEVRALVTELMPRLDITKANIGRDIEVTFDDPRDPQVATAQFEGFFHARDKRSGAVGGQLVDVEVELVRKNQVWYLKEINPAAQWREEVERLRR